MDVAAWLQGLGLERYVPAFRDNDVDAEVLLKLTAGDLISINASMLDFVTGWDVMSKKLIIGLLLGICFWIGLGLLAYLVLL